MTREEFISEMAADMQCSQVEAEDIAVFYLVQASGDLPTAIRLWRAECVKHFGTNR